MRIIEILLVFCSIGPKYLLKELLHFIGLIYMRCCHFVVNTFWCR
jgi:hypothetical protein